MDYVDLSYLFLYLNCINILDIANLLYKIKYIQYMYRKYIHKKLFLCVIKYMNWIMSTNSNIFYSKMEEDYTEIIMSFNDLRIWLI